MREQGREPVCISGFFNLMNRGKIKELSISEMYFFKVQESYGHFILKAVAETN